MEGPSPHGDERRPGIGVLVVDDCRDTARMMRVLPRGLGYGVRLASTGREAIEVAGAFHPEVALADIALPDMDGDEVASRLREEECGWDAVVVAISGYGQDGDRRRSNAAGFDHHVTKPLDHNALLMLLSAGSNGR